jgi:hypothetical protein
VNISIFSNLFQDITNRNIHYSLFLLYTSPCLFLMLFEVFIDPSDYLFHIIHILI